MNRIEELTEIVSSLDSNVKKIVTPLLDEIVFIESKLNELKRLPLIRVNIANPEKQETTPAGKMYKEYMQAYNNNLKIILSIVMKGADDAESPLLKRLKEFE